MRWVGSQAREQGSNEFNNYSSTAHGVDMYVVGGGRGGLSEDAGDAGGLGYCSGGSQRASALRCWQNDGTNVEIAQDGYGDSWEEREDIHAGASCARRCARPQREDVKERHCRYHDSGEIDRRQDKVRGGGMYDRVKGGDGGRRQEAGRQGQQRSPRLRRRSDAFVATAIHNASYTECHPYSSSFSGTTSTAMDALSSSTVQVFSASPSPREKDIERYSRRGLSPRLTGATDEKSSNKNSEGFPSSWSDSSDYVPSWAERTNQRHCKPRQEGRSAGSPEETTNFLGKERVLGEDGGGSDAGRKGSGAGGSSPTPDPNLLSTLKRGGSRNARCERVAASS